MLNLKYLADLTEKLYKDSFISPWKKLFSFSREHGRKLLIAILLMTIGMIMFLSVPDRIGNLSSIIQESIDLENPIPVDLDRIAREGIFIIIILGIGITSSLIANFVLVDVVQRISYKLRETIDAKINRLPLSYFDGSSTGDILSRVTNDVDTASNSMSQFISAVFTNIVLGVGSAVMMFHYNIVMTVASIGSCVIGMMAIGIIVQKSQKYFNIQQKRLGDMNGLVEEEYSGYIIVKSYSAEEENRENFDIVNNSLFRSGFITQSLSGLMMPLMTFVGNLGYVTVCVVGGYLVLEGYIPFAIVISMILYMRFFNQSISGIGQAVMVAQAGSAACARVFEMLEEEEIVDDSDIPNRIEQVSGNVEFRNVRFGYTPEKEIIHGFSANIRAGDKVAIVGPTGAGKSTIINLLMRFYDFENGDILIDGVSIKEMRRDEVRSLFCMVLQDTWMFDGTIRENIVYNSTDVTDEDLDRVCKAVGLKKFIDSLPDHYDTRISEESSLSAGQKQQITIARAMIDKSPMLILDEATSSVDTMTEIVIQKAMESLSHSRTSFIIAHRLSTIRNADLILVMKDGDIIEQGTHEELLDARGFYNELYNSQFA